MNTNYLKVKLSEEWNRLSLRRQIAISLWLCAIPISAAGTVLMMQQAHQIAIQDAHLHNAKTTTSLAHVMKDYLDDNQDYLSEIAEQPSLRRLDPSTSQELLDQARVNFPNETLSIYKLDGSVVASNSDQALDSSRASNQQRQNSTWFKQALNDNNSVTLSKIINKEDACLLQAKAIRNQGKAVGILQSCLSPEYVGSRSGISNLINGADTRDPGVAWLDLEQGIKKGAGILLISKQGELLLLHKHGVAVTNRGQLINQSKLRESAWYTLTNGILRTPISENKSSQYELNGYLISSIPLGPNFRLAAVIDTFSASSDLQQIISGLAAINLLTLLICTIVISRISKPLLKPIDIAGEALRQISDGNFDVHLPPSRNNDVGRLFNYITNSAERLKAFVSETTKNAVINAQISEAKRLQADFLVEQLPQTRGLEIAALWQPAYDVGADWYDAMPLGDTTAIVVADVCDKGIPSALYMSVFRSLLRLCLEKEWQNHNSYTFSVSAAVSTVNRYMAETHGHTGMFATAFIAVYEPNQKKLNYVLAGHEAPLLRSTGQAGLTRLELSGPALGLFPQAEFQMHSIPLRPGDLLLAFSDGLPDGRNDAGEAFGHARIEQLVENVDPNTCSAQALLEQVRTALAEHCQGAEAFDDLTLMTLKHAEAP